MFRKVFAAAAILLGIAHTNAQAQPSYNLTTAGSEATPRAGIDFYTTTDNQSTGSGVIHSFVRISANTDIVEGYNTDARPLEFDENNSPTFTRSLLLSDVPTVLLGGVVYREFLLDINQQGTDPLLSLNEVQIFTTNNPSLTGATVGSGGELSFADATQIYSLDGGGVDRTLELNYNLNAGSGSGDLFAYIADSLFTGGTYAVLYSSFGDPNANNDGFEEWAVRRGGGVVPEPASIVMALTGMLPLGFVGLRRHLRRKAEAAA